MGFPFDTATWDGVSGPIFMGNGGAMPALFSLIAIGLCVGVIIVGQTAETAKYKKFK